MSVIPLIDCDNKDNYDALALIKKVICVDESGDLSVNTYDVQTESCTPLVDCSNKDNWDLESILKSLIVVDGETFKIRISSV